MRRRLALPCWQHRAVPSKRRTLYQTSSSLNVNVFRSPPTASGSPLPKGNEVTSDWNADIEASVRCVLTNLRRSIDKQREGDRGWNSHCNASGINLKLRTFKSIDVICFSITERGGMVACKPY